MIRDGIYNINTTESFTLLASSFNDKGLLEVLLSTTTSFTLSAAATYSTLSAPANSHNEDLLEAKFKCGVAKISGIKLDTKQLKQR